MTPQEAGDMLDWIARRPARVHRYRLEGGTRRRFDCIRCKCATEAESPEQAGANLTEFGEINIHAALCYGEHCLVETGILMPPSDFS